MNKYKNHVKRLSLEFLLALVGSIPFLIAFFFITAPTSKKMIQDAHYNKPIIAVQAAYSLLDHYYTLAQNGQLSVEQAKESAKQVLKDFRYEGNEYVWINNLEPVMIMHPFDKELIGKNLSEVKDPNGKKIFHEMIKIVEKKDEGLLDYSWQKPGEKEPVSKVSYVKMFKPWGWIIGSGVYIDNVQKAQSSFILENVKAILGAILIMLVCASFISLRTLTRFILPVEQSIQNVLSASLEVSHNSDQMKTFSEVVKSEVESQSTALHEFNQTIQSVSDNAGNAKKTVETAQKLTSEFNEDFKKSKMLLENMSQELNELLANEESIIVANNDMISTVEKFRDKFEEISNSVQSIEEIVFQTKLLSFNASVEAARAGESGKGFSVVAEEIGNLAAQSGKSGHNIMELVEHTLGSVETMVNGLKETNREIEIRSNKTSEKTQKIFQEFYDIFNLIDQKNDTIKSNQNESNTEVSSVSTSMIQMKEAANSINTSNVKNEEQITNVALIANELDTRAVNLRNDVKNLANFLKLNIQETDNKYQLKRLPEHLSEKNKFAA